MAATNGYTAEQASDLYITDGSIDDWLWGDHGSSPTRSRCTRARSSPGFYPPDEADRPRDEPQPRGGRCCCSSTPTARSAVIGKAAQYCGTAPLTTLFAGKAAKPTPPIALTGGAKFSVSFRYRSTRRTSSIRLRVQGGVARTLFRERGRSDGWTKATLSLSRFAGRTVRLEFVTRDAKVDGLIVTRV